MDMMDLQLTDRRTDNAFSGKMEERVTRVGSGMLRTVWDFSEQQGQAVFVFIDFAARKVRALVKVGSNLVASAELKDLKGGYSFSPEEGRAERLEGFFSQDLQEMVEVFQHHGRLLPTYAWLGNNTQQGTTKSVYGYGGSSDGEEIFQQWRQQLEAPGAALGLLF